MEIPTKTAMFFSRNKCLLVPVAYKTKMATDKDYQKQALPVEDFLAKYDKDRINVGVLLAPPLVDVDVDFPPNSPYFAYTRRFFPRSTAIYGRASRPNGHFLYATSDKERTWDRQLKLGDYSIEVRATDAIQSVVPPSIHPSGEKIEWSDDSELGVLTEVTLDELRMSARRFIAAATLADLWSGMQGARHMAALPFAGSLLRLHKSKPDVFGDVNGIKQFMRSVFEMAGDEEVHDRMRAADDTFKKFESGTEKLTGTRRLIEFFGDRSEKEVKSVFSLLINDKLLERIEAFNEEFASINLGGKAMFLQFKREEDGDDEEQYKPCDLSALRNHGTHNCKPIEVPTAKGGQKLVPFVEVWRNHTARRHYDRGLNFVPPRDFGDEPRISSKVYNTYQGFKTKPIECDVTPFTSYVEEVVANGNKEHAAWVMAWCADIVQHPGDRSRTGLVLRGRERTGKTTLGNIMRKLIFPYGYEVDKIDALTGRFNSHLSGKLLIVANEAVFAGDRSQHSRLKSLITDETITIEHKGVNAYNERSHIRVLLTTNERWAVPATFTEQRWTVLDVSDLRADDKPYFKKLYKWLEGGGYEGIMHYLLNLKYDRELIHTNLRTAALQEQQMQTVSPVIIWWKEQLEAGQIGTEVTVDPTWYRGTKTGFGGKVMRELFMMSYEKWGKGQQRYHNVTNISMGTIMAEFLGKKPGDSNRHPARIYDREQQQWDTQLRYFYKVPPLAEARDIYKKITGQEIEPASIEDSALEATPLRLETNTAVAKHGL